MLVVWDCGEHLCPPRTFEPRSARGLASLDQNRGTGCRIRVRPFPAFPPRLLPPPTSFRTSLLSNRASRHHVVELLLQSRPWLLMLFSQSPPDSAQAIAHVNLGRHVRHNRPLLARGLGPAIGRNRTNHNDHQITRRSASARRTRV